MLYSYDFSDPHKNLMNEEQFICAYFTDNEIKAQRVTCPRLRSLKVSQPRSEPRESDFRFHVLMKKTFHSDYYMPLYHSTF